MYLSPRAPGVCHEWFSALVAIASAFGGGGPVASVMVARRDTDDPMTSEVFKPVLGLSTLSPIAFLWASGSVRICSGISREGLSRKRTKRNGQR